MALFTVDCATEQIGKMNTKPDNCYSGLIKTDHFIHSLLIVQLNRLEKMNTKPLKTDSLLPLIV